MSQDALSLALTLKALKLPAMALHLTASVERAIAQESTYDAFLHELAEIEIVDRRRKRTERLLLESRLPPEKTFATLDRTKLPTKIQRMLPSLLEGDFVDRAVNLLAFGLPGRGKTHLLCAIGHQLVRKGRRVLFSPAFALVQRLLVAKRELRLERELTSLEKYEVIIVDDIGYVQQAREEMEVLFTFLSARYERASVMISSNLVFSEWDKIFKDAMTTAAAVDRLVHHAVILELTGKSHRGEVAIERQRTELPDES